MDSYNNKFHLSFDNEVNFWLNNILNNWIKINHNCPNCGKINSLRIRKNKKSLSNPIKLQCNNKKCKKIVNIREKTIFSFINKYPISVIIKIIELFILENKNATEITKYMIDYYKLNSINSKIIYRILNLIRKYISHFLKEIYEEKLASENEAAYIAIDESLFCHFDGTKQIWLIDMINTSTYEFRIEAVYERNSEIMKKIIKHHIGKGNTLITEMGGEHTIG